MDAGKRAAGYAAAERVDDGMTLGLGTGSTVAYFLDAVAERGVRVVGVPTSVATQERCRELGIELRTTDEVAVLDLCVDGADELTHDLILTKGGGGALLREKVVASMARGMIVIATVDKVVDRLADTFPLPIEVVPFAVAPVARRLDALGFHVEHRGGGQYRTDNGNAVLDARMPEGLNEPARWDAVLATIPGVAEHGLFVGLATEALLGTPDGQVERLAAS